MDHWRGPGRRRAAGADMPWYLPWRTCTYPKAQWAACTHPLAREGSFSLISLNGFRLLNT